MAYAHGKAIQHRSCMVADFTDGSGNLTVPHDEVTRYLTQSGIRRIVTGHKPCGDSPGVMRLPAFEVRTRSRGLVLAPDCFYFGLHLARWRDSSVGVTSGRSVFA